MTKKTTNQRLQRQSTWRLHLMTTFKTIARNKKASREPDQISRARLPRRGQLVRVAEQISQHCLAQQARRLEAGAEGVPRHVVPDDAQPARLLRLRRQVAQLLEVRRVAPPSE